MYALRSFHLRYLAIIKMHTYSNTVSKYEFLFIKIRAYIETSWTIM